MKKLGEWGTTVYVYDAFGELAAEYSSTTTRTAPCQTCYLSYDHLGSVRVVTDQGGAVVGQHDYLPFGEELASGQAGRNNQFGATDGVYQKFTGQERDQETGLDYFQARYYGAALGRFSCVNQRSLIKAQHNVHKIQHPLLGLLSFALHRVSLTCPA